MLLRPVEFLRSPEAMAGPYPLAEAERYTRWLATSHYENFHVVSFLLPRRLHQDFFNVYAYCRWADDLGDEIGDRARSLELLEWWRGELDAMYAGRVSHPVFVALAGTVARHAIPREPFADLIRAFVQDQSVGRYRDWDELFAYCRWSANPVGRLVLHLCGYTDEERRRLSDATCTALQLANFWQDVTVDTAKDRVYMPLDVLARHNCPVEDLFARRFTLAFRDAMRECVARARVLFETGLPLAGMVNRRLGLDLDLFSRGGMRVLDLIERRGYDVLAGRPSISRGERARLMVASLARTAFGRRA